MSEEKRVFSCTDCGVLNCHKRNASYPDFCLTAELTDEEIAETKKYPLFQPRLKANFTENIQE